MPGFIGFPELLLLGLLALVLFGPKRLPEMGRGLGKGIIRQLVSLAKGHKKIILYANPGTEGFYRGLGFLRMNTAMAIWQDPARAVSSGLLSADP